MANLPERIEIKKAVLEYSQRKAISMNALATQMGVSGSTLSKISNDNWDSINNSMWLKVWNYLQQFNGPQLFSTSDFTAVANLCTRAKNNRLMVGLTADTGMGKTTALKAYARAKNVFYIYYNSTMRPKHFFYELGKLLGYEFEGNMYEMVNRICETLNTLEAPLIIVDEASKLTDPMLFALHILRDSTMHNCGIVLAGMPYFKNNLIKKANKQKTGISEFLSRVMLWHELNGLLGSEIEYICESNGIADKKVITKYKGFKRFRDLANEILLYNTIND